MDKTIFGLAYLNCNWENNGKDIIDSYVPLACKCIIDKEYTQITRDDLHNDFNDTFGLSVDLGPCETILKRMVKDGYLTKDKGIYQVETKQIYRQQKGIDERRIEADYTDVITNIVKYAKEKYTLDFQEKEIENGLLLFLKEFDIDITLASNDVETTFSKIGEKKKLKFVISKYIIDIQKSDSNRFRKIVDIAKGHAIAMLIAYENVNNYTGKLDNVEIYLDAPIIFNLLGINGESNLALANELVSNLKKNGAQLKIFELNNNEVANTILDAIERLKTGNYLLHKSSRVLRTAVREQYTANTLQIKLNQLEDIYKKHNVQIVDSPSVSNVKYEIDQNKLTEIIENIYTKNGEKNLPYYKQRPIENDVETISYIYRIRKDTAISNLKNSKAILLTSNEAIAFASKHNEVSAIRIKPAIPPCLTDIFLSTILWANYPSKNNELNIKRLISECYANTELDNKLLQRFYNDIEKMHKEQTISNEQFYLLNSSTLTYKILQKQTLNDIEEYTDKTPAEVVEDVINSYKQDEITINKNIQKLSNGIGSIIFWLIFISLVTISILNRIIMPKLNGTIWEILLYVFALFLGVFGLFRWGNIIPDRKKIIDTISNYIYKGIMKALKKERD
jgi:hypothetical protein